MFKSFLEYLKIMQANISLAFNSMAMANTSATLSLGFTVFFAGVTLPYYIPFIIALVGVSPIIPYVAVATMSLLIVAGSVAAITSVYGWYRKSRNPGYLEKRQAQLKRDLIRSKFNIKRLGYSKEISESVIKVIEARDRIKSNLYILKHLKEELNKQEPGKKLNIGKLKLISEEIFEKIDKDLKIAIPEEEGLETLLTKLKTDYEKQEFDDKYITQFMQEPEVFNEKKFQIKEHLEKLYERSLLRQKYKANGTDTKLLEVSIADLKSKLSESLLEFLSEEQRDEILDTILSDIQKNVADKSYSVLDDQQQKQEILEQFAFKELRTIREFAYEKLEIDPDFSGNTKPHLWYEDIKYLADQQFIESFKQNNSQIEELPIKKPNAKEIDKTKEIALSIAKEWKNIRTKDDSEIGLSSKTKPRKKAKIRSREI